MAGLSVSCHRQSHPFEEPEEPVIGIAIEFPSDVETKGEVGPLPASNLENALHTVSFWVFRSDNHEYVAARDLGVDDFPSGGGTRRYTLTVSREFVEEKPDVDVFVLANAAAISSDLNASSTWDDLNMAFFGDTDNPPYYGFGIAHPVHEVDPELGLPMSGCGKNLPVEGEEPVLSVRTVKIGRMVSRLRFVFCQTRTEGDEEDEVSINSIVLGAQQIPLYEYIFTTGKTGIVMDEPEFYDNYLPSAYIIPGPDDIAKNDTPEKLIYVNQNPQAYDKLISDAVAGGTLTDMGRTYFRESDRRLSGTIAYTVNGRDRIRPFDMLLPGDFARNHTWTVFGYFLSGRNLQLSLNVLPWDYNSYVVDFSSESVNVASKFEVDDNTVDLIYTSKDHYDARLLPGKAAKGTIYITTPVGGHLMIRPSGDVNAFTIEPDIALIDPTINSGRIDITIRRNPDIDEDLTGSFLTLSFFVETTDGRLINADSEAINNYYRFVL
jgi:hypothetical protein